MRRGKRKYYYEQVYVITVYYAELSLVFIVVLLSHITAQFATLCKPPNLLVSYEQGNFV